MVSIDPTNPNIAGAPKKEAAQERTLFTKEQFSNSIMKALNRAGANQTQKTNFTAQANSIFTQYDKSPQDNKWTETEANTGGANALAAFYETVNNIMKGIGTPAADKVEKASDVAEVSSIAEVNNTPPQSIEDEFAAMPREEQINVVKGVVLPLISAGYEVSLTDDGKLKIVAPDGSESIEDLDVPVDVFMEAVGQATDEHIKEQTLFNQELQDAGINDNIRSIVENAGLEFVTDEEGGFAVFDPNDGAILGEFKKNGSGYDQLEVLKIVDQAIDQKKARDDAKAQL